VHDWSKRSTDQQKNDHDEQKYFNSIAGTRMSTQQAQSHTYVEVERVRGIESDFMYGTARQTPSEYNAVVSLGSRRHLLFLLLAFS